MARGGRGLDSPCSETMMSHANSAGSDVSAASSTEPLHLSSSLGKPVADVELGAASADTLSTFPTSATDDVSPASSTEPLQQHLTDVELGLDDPERSDKTPDASPADSTAALGATTASRSAEKPQGRMYVLDNAKFVLIICVEMTHFLAPLQKDHVLASIFEGVRFAFMMPAFTFISGYCSSTDFSSPRKIDGILKVIAIYVMCQFFWVFFARYNWWGLWDKTCFGKIISGNAEVFTKDLDNDGNQTWKMEDWLQPYFHLWYLFCLIWWKTALPYWWRLKYPVATAWLVAAAFCAYEVYKANPFTTWMVDVPYIVGWFPLFCLGARAKQAKCELWDHPYSPLVGFLAICSIAWMPIVFNVGGGFFAAGGVWAYGTALTSPFGEGFVGNTLMFLSRLGVPIAHTVGIWGFLHLMPRGELPLITGGGERCLACYIFHPLGGPLLSMLGVYGSACDSNLAPAWAEVVIILFCCLSAMFWTSKLVWKLVWPFCDPPVHHLLRGS